MEGNKLVTTTELSAKQDKLVSGTNIKTINGNSILGSGDISVGISTTGVTAIVAISESGYAALTTKDATTLYIVTPDTTGGGNGGGMGGGSND